MEHARQIRAKILDRTKCVASVGIGPNVLLARLATRRAKPDNVFRILREEGQAFVSQLPVSSLPGVGRKLTRKLEAMGVNKGGTCAHLYAAVLPLPC